MKKSNDGNRVKTEPVVSFFFGSALEDYKKYRRRVKNVPNLFALV